MIKFYILFSISTEKIKLKCKLNNKCKITQTTRRDCSACRLKKCFSLGMNQHLVRKWSMNQLKTKHVELVRIVNKNENQLPAVC
jgi:hypothetical protein